MERSTERRRVARSTITDVAAMAGVSKTTVSRYLSGRYGMLAEATLAKIAEAIAALDFRPNQMARGLKRNRSDLIGMVVADITNPYSTAILRGAEDVCKQHGLSLLVCNTDNDPMKEREYIFMLQAHRIDGLIINTTGANNEFLHQVASEEIPVVLVDRKVPALGFDTVGVDNRRATTEAIGHLQEQGYERIAFFSEPFKEISTRLERVSAFRKMVEGQQRNHSTADVYEIDLSVEGQLEEHLETYLQSSTGQARAIFAANGVIMLQLLLALQKKKLQVPTDVAVAGFDNLDWTPVVACGITAIEQPTYAIGVTAMERVLKRIEGDEAPVENIELPCELIIRKSTASVKTI